MKKQTPLGNLIYIVPVALALTLSACGGGNNDAPPTSVTPPPPPPTPAPPPPPPPPTGFNVSNCINQVIPGTGGLTVGGAIIPDTLKLNLAAPSGFPNGRQLTDSVIDVTLAIAFLDLTAAGQSPSTFANLPLGPQANDEPFRTTFPYLAAAQGAPPLSGTAGTNFNFRTEPLASYTRVDRMGMPAVATALIGTAMKNAYNDASPADDLTGGGRFAPEFVSQLTALTNALADDLVAANLRPCARPA